MIEALQVQIIDRPRLDEIFHHAIDPPCDHDLAGLGFIAQPRGEVGDRADRGVFEPLLETDLAERRIAERDADAKSQAMPAVAPALGQLADGVGTRVAENHLGQRSATTRISTAIFTARRV